MGLRIEKEPERLILRLEKGHLGYQKEMLDVSKMALPHIWEEGENEIRLIYCKQEKTLKQWIRTDPNAEEMEAFFRAVTQLDETVDCFLLEDGRILFDPDWIGWDPVDHIIKIVYSPFDPYALGSVPFWSRLAGYFHQALIAGLLCQEGVETVVLNAERSAFLRKKKDPAWAGSWMKTIEEPVKAESFSEDIAEKQERMAQREKALDELIEANGEKGEGALLMGDVRKKIVLGWKKNMLQWKERFPIALKD